MKLGPETLAAIHAAAFTDQRPWGVSEFQSLLEDRHIDVVGDERGFVLTRVVAQEAEILSVATHPDHQRQGHARALLAQLEDALAGRADVIFLEVDADNAPARALYQAVGYVQTGMRKGYYAHKDRPRTDALILAKKLR